MRGVSLPVCASSRSPWRMTKTAFSLQRMVLNTSAMSASPMESMGMVATGVSTQFGSTGVVAELAGFSEVAAELKASWTAEELD